MGTKKVIVDQIDLVPNLKLTIFFMVSPVIQMMKEDMILTMKILAISQKRKFLKNVDLNQLRDFDDPGIWKIRFQ